MADQYKYKYQGAENAEICVICVQVYVGAPIVWPTETSALSIFYS